MAIGRGGVRIPIITEFDEKGIKNFSNSMGKLGKNLTRSVTLPILGIGVAALKMSVDFETSMGKISGLVGVASDQTKVMGDQAIVMASKFGKSALEAGNALFFITSAGLRGKAAMDVLESSLMASAVGLGDTAIVADVLTSAVNAYGADVLSASVATDTLVAAVREGKLEATELASSIGSVLPIASALGVSLGDVAGAMAALSRTGTNAATAATQLRGILNTLLKPSASANKEFERIGLSAKKLREQLREKGLLSVLITLKDAFGDNEEAIARVFGNARALAGVIDLTGASIETTRQIMHATNNTADDTAKAFAVIAETSGFKTNVAINTLKNSMIAFGDILAPTLVRGAEFVKALADRFVALTDEQKKVIIVTLGVAAAIGPVLLIISLLIKGVLVLGTVFALFTKTIVLVPLAFIFLIGAFRLARSEQSKLAKESRTNFEFIFEAIKEGVLGSAHLIDMYVNALGLLSSTISFAGKTVKNSFLNSRGIEVLPLGTLTEYIEANRSVLDISGAVESGVKSLSNTFKGMTETVKDINSELDEVSTISEAAEKQIEDLVNELNSMGTAGEGATNKTAKLKDTIKLLREEMVRIKTQAVEALKESLSKAEQKLDEARGKFNAFKDAIAGSISGIINFGKAAENDNFLTGLTLQAEAATTFADRVKTLIQMGLSEKAIHEVLKAGNEAGLSIADQIIAGGSTVVNQVNTLVESVTSVAEQVGVIGGQAFFQAGIDQGQALVNGILEALRQAQDQLAAAMKAAASGGGIPQFGARASKLFEDISNIKGGKKRAKAEEDFASSLSASGRGISAAAATNIRQRFKLAKGGIVMGPTNALIGEAGPEAVIPLSGANSARGSMGTTINITVNAGLGTDGTLVGRQIVESIKRYERSSGPVFVRA